MHWDLCSLYYTCVSRCSAAYVAGLAPKAARMQCSSYYKCTADTDRCRYATVCPRRPDTQWQTDTGWFMGGSHRRPPTDRWCCWRSIVEERRRLPPHWPASAFIVYRVLAAHQHPHLGRRIRTARVLPYSSSSSSSVALQDKRRRVRT